MASAAVARPVLIPVTCTNCGHEFVATRFRISVVESVTLVDGYEEQCPECGNTGRTPGGTYGFDKNGGLMKLLSEDQIAHPDSGLAEILAADHITPEMLERFNRLVQNALRYNLSQAELAAEAQQIDPAFKGAVDGAGGSRAGRSMLAAAIAGALVNSCNVNIDFDVNEALDRYMDRGENSFSPAKNHGEDLPPAGFGLPLRPPDEAQERGDVDSAPDDIRV